MRIFLTLAALLGSLYCFSQQNAIELLKERKAIHDYLLPDYQEFSEESQISLDQASVIWQKYFKGKEAFGFELTRQEKDHLGNQHDSYQQTYQNIPLSFSNLIVHHKNGKIYAVNGRWTNHVPKHTTQAISEEQALKKALQYIDAKVYKWEIEKEEKHLQHFENDKTASYYPKATLEFASPKANLNPEQLTLCYKFNIYAHEPMSRKEIFISATNGEVIFVNDLIHTGNSPGTAQTAYSGIQNITTDSISQNQFRLQQTAMGNGVRTYDLNNATTYGGAVDFTDADNVWNNINLQLDQYATDAHWGAESTYEYFFNEHNRNSINNAGFPLVSYVHYDNNYANAFWNGQYMTYGDGGGGYTPLTSLDIAGHEIAHGLTTFSANLIYQSESGALNESFSDIFGAAIEFYARPNRANWLIGEDIGGAIRSMSNPNSFGDPDTRNGNNWLNVVGCSPSNQNDNCGVHINSGVQNFWFYLLSTGGSGTNDLGDSYSVSAIGITKAAAIAYRNLTVYLGRTSNYDDARFYSIISAIDLYGPCSPEVESVTDAWHAVGVGNAYQPGVIASFNTADSLACSPPHNVNFINSSSNGQTFRWDFGDGTTSNLVNPVKSYQSNGFYDVKLFIDGGNCGVDSIIKTNYIKIDNSINCIAVMEDGFNPTEIGCNGKIYDSGGIGGNYDNGEDAILTISPPNATSITLTFNSFDVEVGSSSTVCDYDYLEIYDGINIAAPSLGKFCNSNLPPTSITSNTGTITLRFHSDQFLTENGFELTWTCNLPSSVPLVDYTVDVNNSCQGIFQFTDKSSQNPLNWFWDFGDGSYSTLQNPMHEYRQNGVYDVKLKVGNLIGKDSLVKSNYVTVNRPSSPFVNNDTVCIGQTASLLATNVTGTVKWYNQLSGGSAISSGTSLITDPLFQDRTYYYENFVGAPSLNVGPVDNVNLPGGFGNFDRHLVFDVYSPMILETVKVYANSNGIRVIEIRDSQGTVLQSKSAYVSSGQNIINLSFKLNVGTNYQLGLALGSTINLFRSNSGLNYPYTIPGFISIKGSNASNSTGFYYYFYDWVVKEEDCISPREMVSIKVDSSCSITNVAKIEDESEQISIYPNPSSGTFNISSMKDLNLLDLKLFDLKGKSIDFNYTRSNKSLYLIEGNSLAEGMYLLQIRTNKTITNHKISVLK